MYTLFPDRGDSGRFGGCSYGKPWNSALPLPYRKSVTEHYSGSNDPQSLPHAFAAGHARLEIEGEVVFFDPALLLHQWRHGKWQPFFFLPKTSNKPSYEIYNFITSAFYKGFFL